MTLVKIVILPLRAKASVLVFLFTILLFDQGNDVLNPLCSWQSNEHPQTGNDLVSLQIIVLRNGNNYLLL